MFSYKSFRTSTSVFMIELKVVKWTPGRVFPNGCGSKSASGHIHLGHIEGLEHDL